MSKSNHLTSFRLAIAATALVGALHVARPLVIADDQQFAAFEKKIAPVLIRRCVTCHNGRLSSGELDLTTQAGV